MTQQKQLFLPHKIAIAWTESGYWLEVEVTGSFLDWLIFRQLPGKPSAFVQGIEDMRDVPKAFESIYGLSITLDDIRRGYQAYQRAYRTSGSREGRTQLRRD